MSACERRGDNGPLATGAKTADFAKTGLLQPGFAVNMPASSAASAKSPQPTEQRIDARKQRI
jgi:hypothetical protein